MKHPTARRRRVGPAVVMAAALVAVWAAPTHTAAQESTDSLRAELLRLMATVDSLRAEVARLQAAGREEEAESALERLRAAAQAAAAAGGARPEQPAEPEFQGRQRSLQALNPEISVNADVFAHVNKDDTDAENFFAREFEISLISSLDPYSRAKVFLSRHVPGAELVPFAEDGHGHGHEEEGGGFSVEEGYVEWVSLPGGLGVKLGRFQQQFGQLNRWHSHALPFQSRSLPHIAFLGEEALSQTGLSVHWLAPFGGAGGTYEATLEVTRSENETVFGESGRPSVLGHVNAFWHLSPASDFDLGVSWLNGSYETETEFLDRNVFNVEAAFNWHPPERSRYRGVQIRGGMMVLDGLVAHEDHEGEEEGHEDDHAEEEELPESAKGFWSFAEVRLSRNLLVGARMDWVENPEDPDQTAWLFSPTVTWWQSEFVRLRAEYDLMGRSALAGREGRLLLQVTFAMGPHKHETY